MPGTKTVNLAQDLKLPRVCHQPGYCILTDISEFTMTNIK